MQSVIIFTQTGFSIAYVIFVAKAFQQHVPNMPWRYWILIFAIPFWLTTLIKSMKKLAPVALFGFIAIFGALLSVMVREHGLIALFPLYCISLGISLGKNHQFVV